MSDTRLRSAEAPASLVAELAGTLDRLVDQPLVGAALFGGDEPALARYRVEGRLGAGATAVVYAARDTLLGRPVALKVLARRDLGGAWRERALQEGSALARLSHPNVVAIHDVGEWQGYSYLAMELVRGETLAAWQGAARRAWPEILGHYLAAGRGLEAAHLIGLVHRDFKPANVLVTEAGRVVVTDFGLAIPADAAASSVIVGTPAYLAPEQRFGAPPRPAADIYSFAVSVCEALIGRPPFLDPELDWQRALAATGVPRPVRRALERALAADPADRWPSMGPLLATIEAALPRARAARRRRVAVAVAAALLSVAAVAGVVASRRPDATGAVAAAREPASAATRATAIAAVAVARELVASDPTAAAALLLETPAAERRDEWSAVARAVLLRPIAGELPCPLGEPARVSSVGEGLLASVDGAGRVAVCELARAHVAVLPVAATCVRVLDAERVLLFTSDGGLAIADARAAWRTRRLAEVGVDGPVAPGELTRCERDLTVLGPESVVVRTRAGERLLVDLADRVPPTPLGPVTGSVEVARSADGRRVLTRDTNGDVRVAAAGARVLVHAATHVAHDADATVAVAVSGTAGTVLDLRTGRVLGRTSIPWLKNAYGLVEVAPSGDLAVVATSRGEIFWWPLGANAGEGWVESVTDDRLAEIAFDATGKRLVWRDTLGTIGVREVGSSRSFELATRQPSICHVTFAGEDRVVAVACDGRTLAWRLGDLRVVTAGRHDLAHCRPGCDTGARAIWSASLSDDGSRVATAGSDGTVGIWPTGAGVRGLRLELGRARAYTTHFDGERLLVGAGEGAALVWQWASGRRVAELGGHEGWVYALGTSRPEGGPSTLVTGSKAPVLRFWRDDGEVPQLRATTPLLEAVTGAMGRVNDLAFSPDGRRVAAALDSGHVVVCDVATGAVTARLLAHTGWARRVLFLDDTMLLSAGDDGRLQRIDAVSGRLLRTLSADSAAIYDLDRRGPLLLTASSTGTVRLWDLDASALVRTYAGHEHFAASVRWHPGGPWFVTGSSDHRACLWTTEASSCHTWLVGHTDEVRTTTFVDGGRVLTASFDGSVRLWSPPIDASASDLAAELERRRPTCLDERQRQTYLDEPAAEAAARARACRAR